MSSKRILSTLAAATAVVLSTMAMPVAAGAAPSSGASLVASGLQGATGSAIGPDGALYVPEAVDGKVTRIDLRTGARSTFARGLPARVIGLGGAIDVAFLGRTAYVLVTVVGSDVGGTAVDGIYRVDGPDEVTVVADLGRWSADNPPDTSFDLPHGLQFALQPYRGGLLVTDGHHNRVLWVSRNGFIREVRQFDNTVPTGLDSAGPLVVVAEAGAVPHAPEDGRVALLSPIIGWTPTIASGFSLLVDVELGRCGAVYALSQGDSPGDVPAGSPALPASGELLRANIDRSFTVVAGDLDLPTSVEIVGGNAYVVTMTGTVLRVSLADGCGWF